MYEDDALERIKRKKLREMFKRQAFKEGAEIPRATRVSAVNKPINVSDATFTTTIQSHPLVVVDCWAPWCGPCHIVTPILEALATDYAGKILFSKLNVDENPRVAMQYQIMSIPTLLVFKDGRLVNRLIGAMPRPMLEQKIVPYL
jgi:thioredoxin 1